MATTGSHLEALSAFSGFISSYLALMRGVAQQRRVKHQIFCLSAFNLLLNMNLNTSSRNGSSTSCHLFFAPYRSQFTRGTQQLSLAAGALHRVAGRYFFRHGWCCSASSPIRLGRPLQEFGSLIGQNFMKSRYSFCLQSVLIKPLLAVIHIVKIGKQQYN